MGSNLRKARPSEIAVPDRVKRAFPLVVSPGILAKAPEEVLPPPPPPLPKEAPASASTATLPPPSLGEVTLLATSPSGGSEGLLPDADLAPVAAEPGSGSSFLGVPAVQAEVISEPAIIAAADTTFAEPPKRTKSSKIQERFVGGAHGAPEAPLAEEGQTPAAPSEGVPVLPGVASSSDPTHTPQLSVASEPLSETVGIEGVELPSTAVEDYNVFVPDYIFGRSVI